MTNKVMVGMSGGVDSSVAVLVLQQSGYKVCGATLKLHQGEISDGTSRTCCSLTDVMDARNAAYKLGAEHYVFNFSQDFHRHVIQQFAGSYLCGETPNPCIDCNRYIKFGKMLERAQLMDINFIATGHYAKVEFDQVSKRYLLKRPADLDKDQTYALYTMTQYELAHTLFPLGNYTKPQVRELATQHGLFNAGKPDSQDICFVPDGNYVKFLTHELEIPNHTGDFVDTSGNYLGPHQGFLNYTIGQRKGLGLNFHSPRYVVKKDAATNTIVLGRDNELYRSHIYVGNINLISIPLLETSLEVTVKIRYRQKEVPAVLYPQHDGTMRVDFACPQRAPAPGQAAVFYRDDIVVGGGIILHHE